MRSFTHRSVFFLSFSCSSRVCVFRLKSALFDATFSRAKLLEVLEDGIENSSSDNSSSVKGEDRKFAKKVIDEFKRKGTGNANQ